MEENLQNFQEQEQNTSHNKKHPIILYIIPSLITGVSIYDPEVISIGSTQPNLTLDHAEK